MFHTNVPHVYDYINIYYYNDKLITNHDEVMFNLVIYI